MRKLRGSVWKNRIASRIAAIESEGHFGDTKHLRNGIWELRFKRGAGFRLYYSFRGKEIIILLCGGDKSSQASDIEKAIKINNQLEENKS